MSQFLRFRIGKSGFERFERVEFLVFLGRNVQLHGKRQRAIPQCHIPEYTPGSQRWLWSCQQSCLSRYVFFYLFGQIAPSHPGKSIYNPR